MKQNLLNKVWLRVWMLVAVMTTALAGTAWADTKTYDFRFITMGDEGWSSSYEKHSKEYDEGTVIFSSADKNSQTITTMPVTKGQPVEFVMKEGYTISAATFTCQQWGTKAQTITLHYSTDGGENYISTGITSSNFTITSDELPDGTNAVKITFSSTSNQVGIKSLDLTYTYSTGGGGSSAVATTTTIDASDITNTDVYTSTEAGSLSATVVDADNNAVEGASVTWSGNNDAVATIDASTGVVTLVAAGTVKFTAAYAGVTNEYYASSATYEMTVTDSTPFTGGDVTFAAATDLGTSPITKNGVTFACSSGALNNGSEYRLYKNSETTFSLSDDIIASGYVIKSIAFTCTGGNPASGFADQEGWETDGNNGTWTGAATSVSFTASNAQVRATEIVVTVGQAAALSSITLSGDYPTIFHVGDAFSHEGIVVTATYEDATTRDVTASAEFTGYDMATAGAQTVTVSYSEGEVTATANYDITVNAPATLLSISLSGTYPTEFGQGDAFSSEGIIVTANFDDNTTADVTAEATFTGYDMDVLGEQTVTVSYEGQEATYTITIVEKKGTATNPYTVAEAIAYIGTLGSATSATEVYVSGIISQVDSYNSKYSSITYWISDNGTTEGQMEVYSGKGIDGADFASVDDLQVGDIVTVKGFVKMYNTTPEFTQNNQLVSLDRPVVTTPSIELGDNEINAFAEGTDGVIIVDYKNITTVVAEVFFCDADGNAATYDWLTASINSINNLEYIIDANASTEARTAYLKVHALDDEANDVYSELITINQAGYVAPVAEFATLPFSFDGGIAGIETTAGLTQEGLGSDYKSSPYLKFDGTGDYVVLAFDERPGKLTFDVKGNTFSDGTFTVQTSEDGTNYTDLETYTELGATQNEEFDNLGENVRYIKWIYTEKVNGNVALGNIALAAYAEPVLVASITVDPATVEASTAETYGALELTYANFTVSGAGDFDVQFYDGEGNELQEAPDWIDAEVEANGEGYAVSYIVVANDGEARTAYFKVYAMDDETNLVYSNLVTINQAAYVAPVTGDQYALFTGDLVEGDYIIYYDGYAMNTDVENGRLMYAEVTPESDVITTSNAAIVWHIAKSGDYWTLYNAEADAYAASTGVKNKAQMLADGTDDMALWEVSDEYEFVNKKNSDAGVNAYLRNNGTFGFACYSTSTGGALSLYKKVGDAPVPTSQTVTVSAAGYATMVAASDLVIPSDVEVFAVEIRGEWAHLEPVTEGIPAGEAVVVKADAGEYVFDYAAETVEALTVTNDLIAATEPVTTDGRQYVLAKPGNEEVGFYKAAGTIAAGKAYLQITGEAPVKGFTFIFDDDADGIEGIDGFDASESIYNLAGQRIQKMQRGINIVGGKKIAVK